MDNGENKPKLKLRANINKKQVWSDIKGKVVIDSGILTFSDGSTYNMNTGEILNTGKGTIEIRSLGKEEETKEEKNITIGPKIFQSEKIVISGVNADIEIKPHDKGITDITISGSEKMCKNILLSGENRTLTIESIRNLQDVSQESAGNGISINNITQIISGVFHGSSISQTICAGKNAKAENISISSVHQIINSDGDVDIENVSGSVIIDSEGDTNIGNISATIEDGGCVNIITNGCSGREKAKIEILAPKGIEIYIDNVDGKINIGDTEGLLDLETSSKHETTIGCVEDTRIESNGRGNISIKKVCGNLEARINDYGSIRIEKGVLNNPVISNNGRGHFIFNGRADNPQIETSDHGTVFIKEASGTVSAEIGERGNITIDKGLLKGLKVENNGRGDFTFKGRTDNADLTANDRGNIYVEGCKNRPYKERNDRGTITVGN
jgi:hypothetical protein